MYGGSGKGDVFTGFQTILFYSAKTAVKEEVMSTLLWGSECRKEAQMSTKYDKVRDKLVYCKRAE